MLSIFSFLIACVAVGVSAWFTASKIFRYQPLSGALLYLCLFLGQITILELSLGVLRILSPLTLCLGAILIGLSLVLLVKNISRNAKRTQVERSASEPATNNVREDCLEIRSVGTLILVAIALFVFIPLYPLFSELLIQIFRVHPLSWDVVSYHLPNVLNYIQSGSFWTLKGTYGYYPGGNELFQIWSFLPLETDSMLGITTASISAGVFLVSTLLLQSVLSKKLPFELGFWTLILWLGCLSTPPFQEMLFDFGRNDITLMFWQLVAVWTLQQAVSQPEFRKGWLLATGISLGLTIGTKPNGVFYLAGFLCLFFARFYPSDRSSNSESKVFESLKLLIIPAGLIGGFWYFRNLIQTGSLLSKEFVGAAVDLSIFKNLLNPALYQPNFPVFFFLFSVGITIFTIVLCTLKPLNYPLNLKLLAGSNAIAIVALILTPSGAGFLVGGGQLFLIQIRYSAAIIPITIILSLFFLSQLFNRYRQNAAKLGAVLDSLNSSGKRRSTTLFLGGIHLIGSVLIVFQLVSYQAPVGLPGYDGIFFPVGNNPSQIYQWVQKNLTHTTIYSVGLRPYGLYGFPFSNRVVYQLESSQWRYQDGLKLIRESKPKYLAISLDPFTRTAPVEIQSLVSQPRAFELVYRDSLALVFRITEFGQALADRL